MRVTRTSSKTFPTEHWNGRWVHGWPATVVPYRLPELLAAPATEPVWFTEGEKDADNLAALGLIATTNPGGAKKWRPELANYFANKQTIYVLEDNDKPGREHVAKVIAALTGIIPNIAVISFPELPEGGDVSDWLELGGNKQLLIARAEEALKRRGESGLQSDHASDATMASVEWLWPNRIALGKFSLIVGMPDEGKGQVLCYIAAQVTKGGMWPCGEGIAPKGNVVLFTAEDAISDTVAPRLEAAGADRRHVHIVKMVREPTGERMFSLHTDLALLRQKILQIGDVVLVEIDPISAYLGVGKVDSYRTTDVRAVLGPLINLAEELNIAIIAVMHFNKKDDVTNVLLRTSDSLAYTAAARHVYGIVNDPENHRKLMVRAKNNLAAGETNRTLAFSFSSREVGIDPRNGKPIIAPYIAWGPDYIDVSAMEAMQAARECRSPSARENAKEYVYTLLSDGPLGAKDVEEAAKANGISRSTLFRAKNDLKVIAEKDRTKPRWRLVLAITRPKRRRIALASV
jgi:hypothetical protein